MSPFGAEIAVLIDSPREQVLHQPGLDSLLFGDERLSLLDGSIDDREHLGDLGLLGLMKDCYLKSFEEILVDVGDARAGRLAS